MNHYSISNSSNASIVAYSDNVNVTQHYNDESKQLLKRIREIASNDMAIDQKQRQEITDCIDDVEAGIETGRIPKVSLKQLLETGAKISSISSFAIKLAETLGYLH